MTNRRDFIKGGIAGGLALSASPLFTRAAGAVVPQYMLIDRAELLANPITTAAWTRLKAEADKTSKGTPTLKLDAGVAPANRYLAQAIVYARIGGATRKTQVVNAIRGLMGTEDGSGDGAVSLRVGRQMAGWVWAANLVDMDPLVKGTRAGYTNTTFSSWLRTMITKQLQGHSSLVSIDASSFQSASNHGAWAHSAYAAIACYLEDANHKTIALNRFKSFIGDRTVPRNYNQSSEWPTIRTWVCLPSAGMTVDNNWVALNSAAPCTRTESPTHQGGISADGLNCNDASRDGGRYPVLGANGKDHYIVGGAGGAMCAALTWRRGGQPDVFTWQNSWFRRCMEAHVRFAVPQNKYATGKTQPWVANYLYGTNYAKVANATGAYSLSWADWLYV